MDEALDREIVEAVRRFVDREVIPTANELEHNDEYPHALVARIARGAAHDALRG